MPKEKDCLNNAVKNCCACREGEDNSVRSNTDIGLRGNIGIKIFGIILSALIVFFNYSPRMRAVRALPKAVFINSVNTSNDAGKGEAEYFKSLQRSLSMLESESTAHGQEGALNVTESGDETLGAKRISVRLFNLFELANVRYITKNVQCCIPADALSGYRLIFGDCLLSAAVRSETETVGNAARQNGRDFVQVTLF